MKYKECINCSFLCADKHGRHACFTGNDLIKNIDVCPIISKKYDGPGFEMNPPKIKKETEEVRISKYFHLPSIKKD